MPIINITQADIAKSKCLDAGWYKAQILRISPLTPSKDKQSANVTVSFLIEDQSGKEVDHLFNSKGWILMPQLYESAVGLPMEPQTFDTDLLLNKQCDVQLTIDMFTGTPRNKISAFLPYGKGMGQSVPF